jgi:predicted transglutaminase-like cysteine proteinase
MWAGDGFRRGQKPLSSSGSGWNSQRSAGETEGKMSVRRRMGSMTLVAVMAALMTALFGQPAQAVGDQYKLPLGFYHLRNIGSNKCAEVNPLGAPMANGELVVQRTCVTSGPALALQLWSPSALNVSGGGYTFTNKNSGKCMDVRNGVNADSTPVQQWECRGSTSMKWSLNPDSSTGVHQVLSQTGGRCLDVRGGAVGIGAQIQIYHCTGFGNPAQVWSLQA